MSAVQGNHFLYFLIGNTYPVTTTVVLQIRLYALYKRSKRILIFLVILFIAKVAVELCMCFRSSSTVDSKLDINLQFQMFDNVYKFQTNHYQESTYVLQRIRRNLSMARDLPLSQSYFAYPFWRAIDAQRVVSRPY